ncbi:hypothetical protein ACFVU2_13290 [Leifsonia sp. NPDC058194]|uniref:hypothetical protein n=1 Tax=Leifsonia sp. NPDC058194 TaxID=3346374 RepID=UPI0036DF7F91
MRAAPPPLVIAAVHGGEPVAVIRDAVLLRSAIERPAATLFGRDAYPDQDVGEIARRLSAWFSPGVPVSG